MVKNTARIFLVAILLAALPAAGLALQGDSVKTLLNNAAKAMGAENLRTLQYSGSGSLYLVGQGETPKGPWPHSVMKSYSQDLNLDAGTSRIQIAGMQLQAIDANSPWTAQYDYWITPYGFLKGAVANNATAENKTVFGTPYKVVTFSVQNKYKVIGYFDDKNMIDKIETTIDHPTLGTVLVETHYREYMDFNGLKFPTVITQNQNGSLAMILIVKDVKSDASGRSGE